MDSFCKNIKRAISEHRLFDPEDLLLVALSGGSDSVALLRSLLSLGYRCVAVHCNFHLRGEESMRDERFVRDLCSQSDVELVVTDFDTRTYAKRHKQSIEMAARELRYDFFEREAAKRELNTVCVAHHRDDNVETVLLNLIRGTGLNGLTGMQWRNGRVVRPMLDVSHKDVLDYLQRLKQPYVTDSTNLEVEFTRNKIRLQLLPLMRGINPSADVAIHKTAGRLAEVAELCDAALTEQYGKLFSKTSDLEFSVDIDNLKLMPYARLLLFTVLRRYGYSSAQFEDIWQHLDAKVGAMFHSAEAELLVDRGQLQLRRKNSTEAAPIELPVEGTVEFQGGRMSLEEKRYTDKDQISHRSDILTLDADKVNDLLTLRRVRKGDRFVPFGMKQSKLVSDFLTDLKLSRFEKENTWVVCCGNKIVWIVNIRPDQRFCVSETTVRLLVVKLNR